jgi:hypothetical protein
MTCQPFKLHRPLGLGALLAALLQLHPVLAEVLQRAQTQAQAQVLAPAQSGVVQQRD